MSAEKLEGATATLARTGNLSPRHRSGLFAPLQIKLLRRLLRAIGSPPMRVTLWNGEEICPTAEPPVASVHIPDPRTLRRLILDAFIAFGDAYSEGALQIEGDLVDLIVGINRSLVRSTPKGMDWLFRRRNLGRRGHSIAQSKDNVHHHYDIGNDFYKLWLDQQLLYTCAYFPHPDATLEEAQIAKMDHVCRKLRLKPGDRVVEAGCGWGALALHMGRNYGAKVKAFNLSKEQVAYARERAASEGLSDRVEFIQDDYRTITGRHDVFVSVGMLEHVGRENYVELGRVIDRTLTDKGRGLIHTIGRNQTRIMDPWTDKRIFPGAHPPTLREMMDIFEPSNFSVLDVENIRLHYAKTLWHWRDRFEKHLPEVRRMFDERFVRMWRFYLCGSQAAFVTGDMQLFQVVFARGGDNDIPWTRADLYA